MNFPAPNPPASVPVAILAAGASRRLGEAKQLVPYRGRSLLAHVIATAAAAAGCGPILVVLGARADALRDEAERAGARVVENPEWASGMGSSVRAAVDAVEDQCPGAAGVLFTVCDQPLVTAELLTAIIRAARDGADLVGSSYDGAIGVPALFARRFFGELRALPGDAGARRVLAGHLAEVLTIPFPGGSLDVDTPEDVARLLAQEAAGRGGRLDPPRDR